MQVLEIQSYWSIIGEKSILFTFLFYIRYYQVQCKPSTHRAFR